MKLSKDDKHCLHLLDWRCRLFFNLKYMKKIGSKVYNMLLQRCKRRKYKLWENNFGVIWCVYCELLSTSVGNVKKLEEEYKIEVYVHKEGKIYI